MSTRFKGTERISSQSNDLRARRTRKSLQNALIELLKEKPYEEISITEIAIRAEVSRPAFYLHFASKEDLLISHVDTIFDEFYKEAKKTIEQDHTYPKENAVILFQYWERYADILRLIVQAGDPAILIERLREYVGVLARHESPTKKPDLDPRMQEYLIGFVAGGAYMLLTQWIREDMPFSAKEMGKLFYNLTFPAAHMKLEGLISD